MSDIRIYAHDGTDRRVHASDGVHEIVRYDRAGKWYSEGPTWRTLISLAEAVEYAVTDGLEVHENRVGGGRFDALYRRRIKEVRS